jgi:hypothetical protein
VIFNKRQTEKNQKEESANNSPDIIKLSFWPLRKDPIPLPAVVNGSQMVPVGLILDGIEGRCLLHDALSHFRNT